MPDAVLAEEGAFLSTMAQLLTVLVEGGKVATDTPLWEVAFGNLLMRGVAYSREALEEVRFVHTRGTLEGRRAAAGA